MLLGGLAALELVVAESGRAKLRLLECQSTEADTQSAIAVPRMRSSREAKRTCRPYPRTVKSIGLMLWSGFHPRGQRSALKCAGAILIGRKIALILSFASKSLREICEDEENASGDLAKK